MATIEENTRSNCFCFSSKRGAALGVTGIAIAALVVGGSLALAAGKITFTASVLIFSGGGALVLIGIIALARCIFFSPPAVQDQSSTLIPLPSSVVDPLPPLQGSYPPIFRPISLPPSMDNILRCTTPCAIPQCSEIFCREESSPRFISGRIYIDNPRAPREALNISLNDEQFFINGVHVSNTELIKKIYMYIPFNISLNDEQFFINGVHVSNTELVKKINTPQILTVSRRDEQFFINGKVIKDNALVEEINSYLEKGEIYLRDEQTNNYTDTIMLLTKYYVTALATREYFKEPLPQNLEELAHNFIALRLLNEPLPR